MNECWHCKFLQITLCFDYVSILCYNKTWLKISFRLQKILIMLKKNHFIISKRPGNFNVVIK